MIRAIGFLSGVCLSVAALLLLLDSRGSRQPANVTQTTGNTTAAELSGVVAAIAEQVDVLSAESESDQAVPADPEPAMADDEPQRGFVETTGEVTAEEDSEGSTISVAGADPVPAENAFNREISSDHESRTTDNEPQNGFQASLLDREHRPDVQAEAQTGDSDRGNSGAGGTYLFWSPFRSEWAAQGFAGRLSLATQVPVEVINAAPGEYRAAFSYQDETERLARIERIETITGLKLE
jgi:hypothetical protein